MKKSISFILALVLTISMVPNLTAEAISVNGGNLRGSTNSTEILSEETLSFQDSQSQQIVTYINPLYADCVDQKALASVWEEYTPIAIYSRTPNTLEEAAAELRAKMAAREQKIVIQVRMDEFRRTESPLLVYNAAIEHTGNPIEGDYIVYNGCSWSAVVEYENIGDGYIFKISYNMYYFTDSVQESEMNIAVETVLEELNLWECTDYEKIQGIYEYICNNVTYDYANLENDNSVLQYTAYSALVNKTAVCQGYAALFYRLALELGVDARVITGYGGGGAHAWNIVQLGGQYYNLDATWDSGQSDYNFFLRGKNNFYDHQPDESFETISFLAGYPISPIDYTAGNDPLDNIVASGMCGPTCSWTLRTDNVLQINGVGVMEDFSEGDAPWDAFTYRICKLELSTEITEIGSYAFAKCSALATVTIPDSVLRIGEGAFAYCTYLSSVSIPDGITIIENKLFANCTTLSEILLPEGLTEIRDKAFTNCVALGQIGLPDCLTSIGEHAFSGCESLMYLQIPSSVITCGEWAFANCTSLVYVYFLGKAPQCTTSIFADTPRYFCVYYNENAQGWTTPIWNGYSAFVWTEKVTESTGTCGENAYWAYTADGTLIIWGSGEINFEKKYDPGQTPWDHILHEIKSIVVKDGITAIGNSVFTNAENVTEVVLPEGLTRIGWGAFYNCYDLKSVDLPDTLTIIDTCAFEYCHSLIEVSIPSKVVQINAQTFTNCTNLEQINVDSGNTRYYSIDGVLFDGFTDTIMIYPAGKTDSSYQVPYGIVAIEHGAFGSAQISSVEIPNSVKQIGNGAFIASAVESVTIPSGVSIIQGATFNNCKNLADVTIPEGVYLIEAAAFCGCVSLSTIDFPKSLQQIEMDAFNGCTSLKSISIPEGQTTIYERTFANCWSLIDVTIPDSVKEIEQFAFNGCRSLTSISLPDGVIRINNGVFMDCTSLINISIPKSVVFVGNSAFENTPWLESAADEEGFVIINSSLYDYLGNSAVPIIPDGVTAISASAFAYNYNIVSVVIPDTISTLENYTFYCCQNLVRVYIPSSVTTIGLGAFGACSYLTSVNYSGTREQWDGITIGADNYVLSQDTIRYNFTEYEIMDGQNQVVEISSGENLTIRVNAEHSDLNSVSVDGKIVNPKHYTVTAGSTIVTICADYLESLGEGNHVVEIIFDEGAAVAKMTVERAFVAGDVDKDGEVSDWDAIVLNRYLAGWNVEVDLNAADVDGDGEVSDWDAIILERYLAGWDVKLES